jgi:hypothetical protein
MIVDFSKQPIELEPSGAHKAQNLIQMIYKTVRNYKLKLQSRFKGKNC